MTMKELNLPVRFVIAATLWITFATIMLPLIWMTYTAFKTSQEIIANPFALPSSFYVGNFVEAWRTANFGRLFLNSLFVTTVSTLGIVLFNAAAGYAFAHFKWKGSNLLFTYFLIGTMIPPQVILIPGFKLMSILELRNTHLALIFTYFSWAPFAVFFLRAYFLSIHRELSEAARIDGCSELGIFWRIMLPLATPALVTVGIFYFVWIFNDFLWPLVYLQKPSLYTVPLGMMNFQGMYTSKWNLQMAALAVATWPPIIFYLIFHRRIQKGLTAGALKGA